MTTSTAPFADAFAAAAQTPAPGVLAELRSRGRKTFTALGLPNRQQEEWRFTRLKTLTETTFEAPSPVASRVDLDQVMLPGAHLLVFVDGVYDDTLSDVTNLPDGVVVTSLVLAAASGSEVIDRYLGSLAPLEDHAFAALNSAVFSDGAVIHLPAGSRLERPIQLINATGSDGRPILAAPRILVVAEEKSTATIVETHFASRGHALSCPVTEIIIGEAAQIEHVVHTEGGKNNSHLAVRQVRLAADSRYTSQTISLDGDLVRSDIGVSLEGENAEAVLDGLYLTDDRQQADTHLVMRHKVPNCNSHQLFKGVLSGRSRAVFNGTIVVDQDAQKTDAKQSNRNLLLSDDAVVNSNPQLEIFADDVRCTHGSTVGRLDDEAIFYLRSRGIEKEAARRMLTLAFAGEILDRVTIEALRNRLQTEIASRLDGRSAPGGSE